MKSFFSPLGLASFRRFGCRLVPRVCYLLAAALSLAAAPAQAATTDISSAPLLVASPSSVKANLLFILDDSGSMGWDFMPDHIASSVCRSAGATGSSSGSFSSPCCRNSSGSGLSSNACWIGTAPFGSWRGHPPFLSASFNGMAYNPVTRYLPPVDATGTDYASQTSANTSAWTSVRIDAYQVQNSNSINLLTSYPDTTWCTDSNYTNCLRNGNYVLPGTVGGSNYTVFRETTASGNGLMAVGAPNAATTEARSWGPHYYNILPSEYCDSDNLRNCQASASGGFTFPAPVRWCDTDTNARASTPAAGSCQAVRTGTYAQLRYPTKYFSAATTGSAAVAETRATVNFTLSNASCNLVVTAVTVNGINLLSANTTSASNRDTLGQSIASSINAGSTGYAATTSSGGEKVKITAPAGANINAATVTFTRTPTTCTLNVNASTPAFSGYVAAVSAVPATAAGFPGSFERVDIIPARTSYPKTSSRTDCTGASCSYAEEMTNFANWWAYYHTRMQSMKSSATRAFAPVTNNRRVGYLSINNNTGADFLNLDTFEGTQKTSWFSKLTRANPGSSTPLRTALSNAGRLYGGQLNGGSLNGSTVKDPMLYSCQRNFTILSTDGFWNESSNPKQLDGGTDIGNQDSGLARPRLDGTATGNTLADVAAYYVETDSRNGTTGTAACRSNGTGDDVCGNSTDLSTKPNEKQVMKTFTLGLGASGYMQFRPGYLSDSSGDYYAVKEGVTANPSAGVCSWQASGSCNWPVPANNTLTTIDDLWHTAVNGGGTYFSASDPTSMFTGLAVALAAIDVQTKAAAAATTSNPNVAAGDNQLFVSNFSSGEWSGDLISQRIDVELGTVNALQSDWSARDLINANTGRTIYMFSAAADKKRKPFDWGSLTADERANFSLSYITAAGRALSQFCSFGIYCVSATDQAAAAGQALVNFIRGERSNEGEISQPERYFRQRVHLLGDIVSSEAVFVKQAAFNYTAPGYAAHKTAVSARTGMVYVGANDGMLHAINAETGVEVWAFVPTPMLAKLYRLADKEYATKHEYFVDGTPAVQDIFDGTQWRTLLVGGLGAGGRSYYAIDITNPSDPQLMWEFTNDNLGLTMGKPEIGQLSDGSWAVFFGSGYNNVSPGDGHGRLFILNAADGSLIRSIDTGVGSSATPSGLSHVRGWVDNGDLDNTVKRVYAGDNLGNVWRFDVNDTIGAAGYDAQLLATLKSPAGDVQPITARPELGDVGGMAMVYIGTGRYLGLTDLADATVQSIYAIKDRLDAQNFGNPRTPVNKFVAQVLTVGVCPAGSTVCSAGSDVRLNATPNPVNLSVDGGWYVDLPESHERVNTDPQLALGTLVVNSNVIESGNVCKVGGSSYANFLDYRTGAPISVSKGVVSVSLGDAIATRPALVKLPNNKVISVSRLSDNRTVATPTPVEPSLSTTRRLSWRDLIQN
jgi:type IV pilus assembly protein PilY1